MKPRAYFAFLLGAALLLPTVLLSRSPACCPAPPSGKPVVNADQTVIMIWDAANKTQHFIRKASFTSAADDFGFLVPTPAQPELAEAGDDAFPYLLKLTEPKIRTMKRPMQLSCACSSDHTSKATVEAVRVLEEKLVAGFNATVLEADSADALVDWLKEHEYAYSPEVQAWAKPYVEAGWKFTALKVAKDQADATDTKVAASALRLSFKTDRPLFPYREPDSKQAAATLGASNRLLRIYFIADARYEGSLAGLKEPTPEGEWTGRAAWSNKLGADDRKAVLNLLKLPEETGPANWWLTEFEDQWQYASAPGDLYFSQAANQDILERPPIIRYVSNPGSIEVMAYALAAVVALPPLLRCVRRSRRSRT